MMPSLPKACVFAAPLLAISVLGCQGAEGDAHPTSHAGTAAGGQGGGTGGSSTLAGGAGLPGGEEQQALLPARIRRLANAEYQASVEALVPSAAAGVTADFIPDSRQSGFTVNEAQRVDPVFAGQLAAAAIKLAADIRAHAAERAPCADPVKGADACATSFIKTFGESAYRRPLGDDEVEQLMTVFHTALDGGSYDEGIELVARAMLQSAAFLYLTEIGDAPAATVKLTPYELASSLSYLIQGGPPSQKLVQLAVEGKLDEPEGRRAAIEAEGLFTGVGAQARTTRVIKEWLGTDRIAETAKDSNIYPDFAKVKAAYEQETTEFLTKVVGEGGSLSQLLGGGWTMVNSQLADTYQASAPGATATSFVRVDTPKRVGILNQGAFLSVFAHAHETAPVLRGVAIMRRVACMPVASPTSLSRAVVPPVPDSNKTTRERFAVHAADPECAGCHKNIDAFGFAFEAFDGMGKYRTEENKNPNLKVDPSTVISGTDFDGSYADSNALAKAMSTSPQVRECFARHMYRAYAATSAPELKAGEDEFVKHWETEMPTDANGKDARIVETIMAFLTNRAFAYRRAQ